MATLPRPRKRNKVAKTRKARRQSSAIVDAALDIRTDSAPVPWSEDKQEQHGLQLVIKNSTPYLAGYFDSTIWQCMVLLAGRHELAVRRAIAAIGALQEEVLSGSVDPEQSHDPRTRFALEECNKSLNNLIRPPENGHPPNLQLILTTCVLFTCFEALQGNCEQAIMHATQGYNIIQQHTMDPENKRMDVGAFTVELDQLTLMMRKLQTQSKGLMGKDFEVVPDAVAISQKRPLEFDSLHEASMGLEPVMNQLTVFFMDLELVRD